MYGSVVAGLFTYILIMGYRYGSMKKKILALFLPLINHHAAVDILQKGKLGGTERGISKL